MSEIFILKNFLTLLNVIPLPTDLNGTPVQNFPQLESVSVPMV